MKQIPSFYPFLSTSTLLMLVLHLMSFSNSQLTIKIYQSSTVVSSSSSQQITIIIKGTEIVGGSSFLLAYPLTWSLGSVTGYNSSSDYCQTGCTISGIQTLVNSVAGTIQLKNLFPRLISAGENRNIRFTLKNIVNPSYALSDTVTVTLLDNTGGFIDIITTNIYCNAKQISCSVSRSITTVSTISQYQFQVNPLSLSIPSNTYIISTFPASWSSSTDSGTYSTTSYSCRGAPNPSIVCPIFNNNLNISSILNSATTASFTYNVTNIKNPGSEQNNNQMMLQFYTPPTKQIAFCYITLTGTTARIMTDLVIGLTGALGSNIKGTLQFSLTQKARKTDIVKIQIPKLYDCSQLYAAFVYVNAETVGTEAVMHIDTTTSTTLNIINLQPFTSQSIASYKIQLYNIVLPKTSATVGQIKVSLSRDGALIGYQSCCSNTYTQLTSSSGLSLALSTYSVGSSSTHYVSLSSLTSLTHPLAYTYIMLQLDSKYTLSNPTYNCYLKDALTFLYPLTCARNTTNKILISNFNKSTLIGNTMFTLGVDAIVLPVTLDTLYLNMVTMDSSYNPIETISVSYSLVATKIQNIKVVPIVSTTYSVTTYTFLITNTNILPVQTQLTIKLPPQVRLSSSSQCLINSTVQSSVNCAVTTTFAPRQQIVLLLNNVAAIGSSLLNQTNISITSITNSLSLEQTQSFYVELLTSTGSIIEQLKQGVTVTMSTVTTAFTSLTITNTGGNAYTMGVTDYQVQITLPIDVIGVYGSTSSFVTGGIKIVVQLPSQFNCISYSNGRPCMVTNQSKSLTYTLSLTSPTSLAFTVPSLINPESSSISSSFTVSLYLSTYPSISQQYSSIQSFQPSTLSYSLTQSHTYLQEKAIIYLKITNVNNWFNTLSNKYLIVKVPSEYTVDGTQIIDSNYDNSTITKTVAGTTLSQIVVAGLLEVINVTITVSNIVNPSVTASTNKWQLELRLGSATGVLIAQSIASGQVGYSISCSMPCRSCSSNTSYCTSCYTSIGSIPQKYLDTVSHTCASSCASSQYLPLTLSPTDLQCYPCSSSCSTCLNISSNCTTCVGSYLYQPLYKCVAECPPQYYENTANNKCTLCNAPCLYCSGSTGAVCSYCVSTYVLTVYVNGTTTCTLACGTGYYNHSNVCTKCSTNCNICSTTNICTSCATNYLLYNGTCLSQCPKGLYISLASLSTICQACQSPCTSCLNFSTYCLSCSSSSSNKYLYTTATTSTCELGCPNGYYFDQYFVCNLCVYPCLYCTSAAVCLTCVTGFYYYASTSSCYSVCPQGTILSSGQCQKCVAPCQSCATAPTTCTSCIQSYFLDTSFSTCNATCSLPYYAINRKCTRCADPCLTCALLEPYTCSSCLSGYFLMGTTCYPNNCPDGSYRSGTATCALCTSGCLTCITSSSTCLSCYPGLYLYLQSCLPSCPTSPTLYYEYQRQCIACQPQCTSCLSTPIQCVSCSNTSLYFNQVSRECTLSCSLPYFSFIAANTTKYCIKCALPCKTCTTAYNKCGSCYNGLYLHNQDCLQNCPTSTYANIQLNACVSCSANCQLCTSESSCTQCQTATYVYRGGCYSVCPPQAEFVYLGKYCRNCTLDNCLLCDMSNRDNPSCLLCSPSYYLYQQKCIEACPEGFEADSVTQTLCIITEDSALLQFLKKLQKYKVWLMPGSALFLIWILFCIVYLIVGGQCVCKADYIKQVNRHIIPNILHFMTAGPQFVSIIAYLVYQLLYPDAYYRPALVNLVLYACVLVYMILNIVQFILVYRDLKEDKIFIQWCNASKAQRKDIEHVNQQQPANGRQFRRFIIVMVFSLFFNRNLLYFIFSGLFRIPISCCQISAQAQVKLSKKLKVLTLLGIFLVELPLIGYSILNIILQKQQIGNYKLFYGAVDLSFINTVSIVFEMVFLIKTFEIPSIYKKYILEGVSNRSLAAFSQRLPQEAEDDDDLNLHRSNSAQGLKKQSQEMKAVQYNSVFDTDQYQDFDFIEPQKVQNAIHHGKFRKKNLKKKKKNGRNLDLDIIDEDSQQSEENIAKKKTKKKVNNKKFKLGYLNNFIYWKPPEKIEKKKPQKQFKMHKQEIMQTIREKQSDFDTITRNDIIFQQEGFGDNSSHDSDPNFELEDSRRALNYQYETFINKNYAKRRHM